MRILVTGATGKVGSRFVPRLLEHGEQVRIAVREPEKADFLAQSGAEVVKGDLLQPDTLPPVLAGIDAVVHLAAFFRGATPEQAHATNLEGTIALAQAILKAGVPKLIFASTNLVYGPGRGRPLNEDDEPRPVQAYPVSKFAAEQALQKMEGLGLTIMRLPFVYGDDDSHLPDLVPMVRFWPSTLRFQMGHHRDVAQALILALDTPHDDGRVYNVADDEPVTIAEVRKLYSELVDESKEGFSLPIPSDPWDGIVDTSRIKQELGFRPIYPNLQAAIDANAL